MHRLSVRTCLLAVAAWIAPVAAAPGQDAYGRPELTPVEARLGYPGAYPEWHRQLYPYDTEYGRYIFDRTDPSLSIEALWVRPSSGTYEDFAHRAWGYRFSKRYPLLKGATPNGGNAAVSILGSVESMYWTTRADTDGVLPDGTILHMDGAHSTLFGLGGDLRHFFRPTELGTRGIAGFRIEGMGGWSDASTSEVPGSIPWHREIAIQEGFDPTKARGAWGLRSALYLGVVYPNGVAGSASFGFSRLRGKTFDGIEDTSDVIFGTLSLEIPTETIREAVAEKLDRWLFW